MLDAHLDLLYDLFMIERRTEYTNICGLYPGFELGWGRDRWRLTYIAKGHGAPRHKKPHPDLLTLVNYVDIRLCTWVRVPEEHAS